MKIAKMFFVWRLGITLLAALAIKYFPVRVGYLGGTGDQYFEKPLLWCWANFDGFHYLRIAKDGYLQFTQAFFPLYPNLIRFGQKLFGEYLISGLIISHLALVGSLYLFFRLVRLDFDDKIAKRSIVFLLLFPTSFYFGSVYTESIFLLFILGAFYLARSKHWILAGLVGALASATRFVGIFMLPALFFEYYQASNKFARAKIKDLVGISLVFVGLGLYMAFLKDTLNDPLYFIHIQPLFAVGRTGGKIILLYQVFWRYFKMILTTRLDVLYFTVWLEFLTGALFLVALFYVFKYLRFSYFVYMFLSFITPTLTGTFSSLPRYSLVLFPFFILLAKVSQKHPWIKVVYPLASLVLLAASVFLFVRGYFVA